METVIYYDEIDCNQSLSPHAILSIFERSRSSAIGGPDQLQVFLKECKIMFVLAKIQDFRYDYRIPIRADDVLIVRNEYIKRGDSLLICKQILLSGDLVVAKHTATLACISAVDGKLTKMPQMKDLNE